MRRSESSLPGTLIKLAVAGAVVTGVSRTVKGRERRAAARAAYEDEPDSGTEELMQFQDEEDRSAATQAPVNQRSWGLGPVLILLGIVAEILIFCLGITWSEGYGAEDMFRVFQAAGVSLWNLPGSAVALYTVMAYTVGVVTYMAWRKKRTA